LSTHNKHIMPTTQDTHHLATRRTGKNPNHHLWNNNGTWWLFFTLHSVSGGSKRYRRSLKTRDLETARRRRDGILRDLHARSGHIAA
jgi:hypothetical protein